VEAEGRDRLGGVRADRRAGARMCVHTRALL
jgi:hypothetical protein